MPSKSKGRNPFYVVLVLAGAAFGLTALGYFIMAAMATYDPTRSMQSLESQHGLLPFMDRHGKTLMIVELCVLAVATLLAIATDGWWTKKQEILDSQGDRPNSDSQETR